MVRVSMTREERMEAAYEAWGVDPFAIEAMLASGWNFRSPDAVVDLTDWIYIMPLDLLLRVLSAGNPDDLETPNGIIAAVIPEIGFRRSNVVTILTWLRDHGWRIDESETEAIVQKLVERPDVSILRVLRSHLPNGERWWNPSIESMSLHQLAEMANSNNGYLSSWARGMLEFILTDFEKADRKYINEFLDAYPEYESIYDRPELSSPPDQ